MKRILIALLVALLALPVTQAGNVRDDDEQYHESIRPGIRRLHPERERAKAIRLLQEQMSRRAEPKDDPWDTTGEVWGTVDVVPAEIRDSLAVAGRRTGRTPQEQATPGSSQGDDPMAEHGYRRMTWQDLPVTATVEQLTPGFIVTDDGMCVSKYVSLDKSSNEVYFVFDIGQDSVPGPLRLCVQHCASGLLDFDQMAFIIDGYDYLFYPANTQSGTLPDGRCWQACDEEMRPVHMDMVYALAHGHWIALKLMTTSGFSQVKMLTEGQLRDFADTLDLYLLMGGVF